MVASSPYYASDDDPPIILFHGTSDQIVNKEQSQELYDSLKAHNVVTELVSVQGGSHGGNEMYVEANLDKMIKFFDDAREAKSAKIPDVQDSLDKDSIVLALPHFSKSYGVELRGNRLSIRGGMDSFRYTIVAVNGSLKARGYFRKELDLSTLPPGVYGIVVKSPAGSTDIVRFVKN
jgi:hypothetical protein